MSKAYEFALPVLGTKVPADQRWIHEVKHDGYHLRVERDGKKVRLVSKGGHDFTDRYPWNVEAALQNRTGQFVVDGEAVVLRPDGISDFDALQSRRRDNDVQLYAFDVMAIDGEDVRQLPLSMRKVHLDRLLRGRTEGMFMATFEQGEAGPALFRAAITYTCGADDSSNAPLRGAGQVSAFEVWSCNWSLRDHAVKRQRAPPPDALD